MWINFGRTNWNILSKLHHYKLGYIHTGTIAKSHLVLDLGSSKQYDQIRQNSTTCCCFKKHNYVFGKFLRRFLNIKSGHTASFLHAPNLPNWQFWANVRIFRQRVSVQLCKYFHWKRNFITASVISSETRAQVRLNKCQKFSSVISAEGFASNSLSEVVSKIFFFKI